MRIPFSFWRTSGGGSVPVVTAVSYGVVSTAGGGSRVVVTVNSSTGCTGITAGAVAFTSFTIDDATHVSGIPGAHAAGVVNVVVTNATGPSTTGTGLIEYWHPTQLSPKVHASAGGYVLGTWTDTRSLANNLVQATAGLRPAVGATLGGFSTVDFDGTDDILANTTA